MNTSLVLFDSKYSEKLGAFLHYLLCGSFATRALGKCVKSGTLNIGLQASQPMTTLQMNRTHADHAEHAIPMQSRIGMQHAIFHQHMVTKPSSSHNNV